MQKLQAGRDGVWYSDGAPPQGPWTPDSTRTLDSNQNLETCEQPLDISFAAEMVVTFLQAAKKLFFSVFSHLVWTTQEKVLLQKLPQSTWFDTC